MEKLKLKNFNKKHYSQGMTYIELIVVLSIFAIMSSVVMFDYGKFQDKVNIKNLANDIALKILQAQKDSLGGKWNAGAPSASWKPAYGVYFDVNSYPKNFVYFVDLNNNRSFGGAVCSGECSESVSITKGNYISGITVVGTSCSGVTSLSAVFTRPDSRAIIMTNQPACTAISYADINISSPDGSVTSKVKIYPSGRIQIN